MFDIPLVPRYDRYYRLANTRLDIRNLRRRAEERAKNLEHGTQDGIRRTFTKVTNNGPTGPTTAYKYNSQMV